VVKLYAAAIFPGFFLAFLYVLYVLGWALINPKIAPKLRPEQLKVPISSWVPGFQAAYGSNMLGGALKALASPGRLKGIDKDGRALGWIDVLKSLGFMLVPLALVSAALGVIWWYVTVYQQASAILDTGGLQPLGGAAATPDPTDAKGVSPRFYTGFAAVAGLMTFVLARYYWRMNAEKFEVMRLLTTSIVPLAVLVVCVLGSILFGFATASEAAAVGAFGAFLLAIFARTLDWKRTKEAVFLTAKTTSMVCWLFVGSAIFSAVFAILGGQALIEKWVLGMNLTPLQFMILSQAIIFILGWPLEWTEIIVIFVPIFLPLLKHFQIDPVLWGVLVFVNLQAAFLSPPVAMSAFYLKGVAPKHVTLNQIFAGMMPYMLVVILCMVIMYLWPGLTLWLPEFLYGSTSR
jgi:TRAP-type mannitol/chloroaromatic compound transport system permease large subunit